ncbi:MAG: hypothetical protein ABGW77_00325 [Campylobacterales bacterium]
MGPRWFHCWRGWEPGWGLGIGPHLFQWIVVGILIAGILLLLKK